MAVFPQAECISFIKNDTKIPNLYPNMELLWQQKVPKKAPKKAICMFQSRTAVGSP